MQRTTVKTKKHLSFDALIECFSQYLAQIEDARVQGRCSYSLHDAVMSGFACMYFQDLHWSPSSDASISITTKTTYKPCLRSAVSPKTRNCETPSTRSIANRYARCSKITSNAYAAVNTWTIFSSCLGNTCAVSTAFITTLRKKSTANSA